MSDVRKWLKGLALEEFASAFESERIGMEALVELDDADLQQLKVPMGPRKLILKAIRALNGTDSGPAAPEPRSHPEKPVVPLEAERRQITVMFCDLVGSTALSESLDPEDLRAVMTSYQRLCGQVVDRYDGYVAEYRGDGLMIYFGWPRAHEDDAERAVHVGLEIIDRIKSVAAPDPLQVRVGIATGPVVVGGFNVADATVPGAAVGETPNLAARVQALAMPDQVAIAPATHRLIGEAFDYQDLGTHDLKGFAAPVRVRRVVGKSGIGARFEALTAGGLTPLVGRDDELALLMERWASAAAGDGQVVLLSGEPGIGKSRLTRALIERLADQSHARLRYQCSPYHTNSAHYPFIDRLERDVGLARDDPAEVKLDKLEAFLGATDDRPKTAAPLFAAMMSLPLDRYPPLHLSPQRQKEDTVAALVDQVAGLARRSPVLLIFEDAHWCDPTTVETLGAIIERARGLPILVVITYRPELEPSWPRADHVTECALSRLSHTQGSVMVREVAGGRTLPDEVFEQIVAKTDGVPLFVEELTKTVLGSDFLKPVGDRYDLDGPLPPLAIPSTLRDSLMARLDRLSPVKEVAQIGACIGREFSYALLAGVSPLQDDDLRAALRQLIESELIFLKGEGPGDTFVFKHALVQDAAYDSLLKSRRQQLHLQLAAHIEELFPETSDVEPELLAHHYTLAGLSSKAIPAWLKAGENAIGRTALIEAEAHILKGLELVADMPTSEARESLELDLLLVLGTIYTAQKGWQAPELVKTYDRAWQLLRGAEPSLRMYITMGMRFIHSITGGSIREAVNIAADLLDVAGHLDDPPSIAMAKTTCATSNSLAGNLEVASTYRNQVIQSCTFEGDQKLVQVYNHDATTTAFAWGAHVLWAQGYPDQAVEHTQQCIESARRFEHPFNLCFALTCGAGSHIYRREPDMLVAKCETATSIAEDQSLPLVSDFLAPWWAAPALLETGAAGAALEAIKPRIDIWESTGGRTFALWSAILGLAYLGTKDFAAGLAEIEAGFKQIDDSGEGLWEAELHRVKGELCRAAEPDAPDRAEASFHQAIAIAQAQAAKGWELRASTSLARLWRDHGKTVEARDLLAPVYEWFTEGSNTADLKDARLLLDTLT